MTIGTAQRVSGRCPALSSLLLCALIISQSTLATRAAAQAWTEFEIDLGNGYQIMCLNSLDIILADTRGRAVIHPRMAAGLGPIRDYAVQGPLIMTRNSGRKPRNAFPGDVFDDVDPTVTVYFSFDTQTGVLAGPLTEQAFINYLATVGVSEVRWKPAVHPGAVLVLRLLCFAVSAVAVLILAGLVVLAARTNRKPAAASPGATTGIGSG